MKDISTIRRTAATMENQLYKLGYTLSKAFKTAWTRVKEGMTVKAQGVTFGNRQVFALCFNEVLKVAVTRMRKSGE